MVMLFMELKVAGLRLTVPVPVGLKFIVWFADVAVKLPNMACEVPAVPTVTPPAGLIVADPVVLTIKLPVPSIVTFPNVRKVVNVAAAGVVVPIATLSNVLPAAPETVIMPPDAVNLPVKLVGPDTVRPVKVPGILTILLDKLVLVNNGSPL